VLARGLPRFFSGFARGSAADWSYAHTHASEPPSIDFVDLSEVVVVEGDTVRLPWPAELVRGAPSYEAPHDLTVGHDSVVEIGADTEREAYRHYGVEPLRARSDDAEVVVFRIWRIQSF